jgi:meso-butanediol dehydrogenase/(S,S)-butanediol dehydrogenase/diacetyl reductase
MSQTHHPNKEHSLVEKGAIHYIEFIESVGVQNMDGEPRVALITGGARGIGNACVEHFTRKDYAVVFTDVSAEDGDHVAAAFAAQGRRVAFVPGDVSQEADCVHAVQAAVTRFGRLDVLVANAGVQTPGSLLDSTTEDWHHVLAVNLLGVVYVCKAALPVMIAQGAGAIVVVSSLNALRGFPGMAAYDASKAAVLAVVRDIAVEHGARGIRANAVCPGATLTDFHIRNAAKRGVSESALRDSTKGYGLLGRVAEPSEIAAVIGFLAGPDASFITGETLVADGGYSIIGARH